MISRELLSEVFNKKVREFAIDKNELRLIYEDDKKEIPDLHYINIHELAHKCKEWAIKDGYSIVSAIAIGNEYTNAKIKYEEYGKFIPAYRTVNGKNDYQEILYKETDYFEADTEPEAIFKACQWILECQ